MSAVAALLLAVAVALALGSPPTRRLAADQSGQADDSPRSTRLPHVASGAVGLAVWAFIGGVPGVVAGAVAAVVGFRVLRNLDDGGVAEFTEELAGQAPDAADMLAACVASGASLERATREVAQAIGSPADDLLSAAAALMAMGAPPTEAWAALSGHEATAPIARTVIRSLDSGAPMADALSACASELRDIRRARVEAMAQAVAVKSVGPLGLCFLPAFLLMGVVPLVAGLVTRTVGQF
jgi:Flp pilus assembly protein TadB